MKTSFLPLLALVLAMTAGETPASALAEEADAGVQVQADAQTDDSSDRNRNDESTVTVTVDPIAEPIQIGRPFSVQIRFGYPVGTRIYFPDKPETKPLTLVSVKSEVRTVLGTSTSETHALVLLAIKTGEAVLKPFEVPVVLPDGHAASVMTPELRISVSGLIGNEESPELASPGNAMPVVVRNDLLIWVLVALAAAAVASLTAIIIYRRWRAWVDAHKPPPPPVPPHERARARLAEIEAMGLVEQREFKTLALLVSEVIREFLGALLGFPGTDSTTWETLESVRTTAGDKGVGRMSTMELEDFLALCDLIKFAKFEPSVADAQALIRRSHEMIDMAMHTAPVQPDLDGDGGGL